MVEVVVEDMVDSVFIIVSFHCASDISFHSSFVVGWVVTCGEDDPRVCGRRVSLYDAVSLDVLVVLVVVLLADDVPLLESGRLVGRLDVGGLAVGDAAEREEGAGVGFGGEVGGEGFEGALEDVGGDDVIGRCRRCRCRRCRRYIFTCS